MGMDFLAPWECDLCRCGKVHHFTTDVHVGSGIVRVLPQVVEKFGGKTAFVISDQNTEAVAGAYVRQLLRDAGITVRGFVYPTTHPEPDEHSVGLAFMYYTPDCDIIIGVGSGVINDIGKLLASATNKPYIIVATAPSMDGYASPSSSMEREGVKTSIPSKTPDAILGDTDFLRQAPMEMLLAGLGDMLAKYVGVCEWRIANLLVGEAYCESVAELIRVALKRCTDNADGLLNRSPEAVEAVFEGLVISGAAMKYAESTRPASGGEHYISHVWDMRGAKAMVAISPATPLCMLDSVLDDIDAVLVMTVNPGFAGQKLVPSTLKKIRQLRDHLDSIGRSDVEIEVDGNVSFENARLMSEHGANIFVAGTSSIFNPSFSIAEGTARLRDAIK